MHSRRLKALLDLTRPVNVGITLLSIPAASILAGAEFHQWLAVLLAAVTGGLVAGAANAINDYFDVEIDRVNKPLRPIPRGDATTTDARLEWFILSALAVVLNLFLNVYALGIVVFAVLVLYSYSAIFKRTILVGNIIVGLMTGMAFVYGAVVVGNFTRSIMPAVFAFLVNVAREIIKDIEDTEGDSKEGARTLPVVYGAKPALILASMTILLLLVSTIVAYSLALYSILYLYIVLAVDILLLMVLIGMWTNQTPANMGRMSNILKICMVIGLVAIFLGSRL